MRFIIPNYRQEDNFSDNVAYTLTAMGHEVITVPRPVRILDHRVMHLMQIVYDKVFPLSWMPQEKWLKKIYKEFKPDVVLALTQELNEELLFELRSNGIRTVAWWGDTAANMRKQGLLVDHWDHIFIKDRYAAFKLRTLGLNADYLPEAMNPVWHRKVYKQIGDSICFAGSAYNYRHYLIRKLIERGHDTVELYGDSPPGWAHNNVKRVYRSEFIVKEQKSRVFGESLACINSTAMSEGNSINCRAFEIAGACGQQILEYREAVIDCFEPGKEILTYSSLDELEDLLLRCRKEKAEMLKVREAGYRRAHAEHTYRHRLEYIIRKLIGS